MKILYKVGLIIFTVVLFLTMTVVPVFAAYDYYFIVSITDTTGTDRTYVPVMLGFGGYNLYSSGYMTITGTDTEITAIATHQPFMLNRAKTNSVVSSISANSTTNLYFYLGYTPVQTAFPIVIGTDGYITTRDNATLELGNNFEIELDGYIDTSNAASKNIVSKQDCFILEVDATTSGTINTTLYTEDNIVQTAQNNHIQVVFGVDPITRVGEKFTNFPACIITSVTLDLARNGVAAGTGSCKIYSSAGALLGTIGTVANGTLNNTAETIVTFDTTPVTVPTAQDIYIVFESTGDVIWIYYQGADVEAGAVYTTYTPPNWTDDANKDLYITVDHTLHLTSAGNASGEHTVTVSADGTNAKLFIDTVEEDSVALATATVIDNANDWLINQNNVMPYINYYTHTVGVVEVVEYRPAEMLGGTDYSTGTATFTNGSPNVTGAATTFTQEMVGGLIESDVDGVLHVVASVTDDTNLVLTANYSGAGGAGHNFHIYPRLEDLDANQDGIITWGSNDGLIVTYSSVLAYLSGSGLSASEDSGFDPGSAIMPPNWSASGGNINSPPAGSIWVQISQMLDFSSTGGGIPKTSMAITIYFMFVVGLTILTLAKTKSLFITSMIMLILLAIGSSLTLIPGWLVFVIAVGGIGILFIYKQYG